MSKVFNKELAHSRGFEPLTSAFGGRRAIMKPLVEAHYNGNLKKVDEK